MTNYLGKNYFGWALLLFTLLCLTSCQKEPPNPEALSSKDPQTLAVKLKQGVKIKMKYVDLERESANLGKWVQREFTLDNPSGAEGVTLIWRPATGNSESPRSAPLLQGQVITFAEGSAIPDSLQDLLNPNTNGGELSLPNLSQARRMTLPAFWPYGDLYLSDSSGIWLSDVAFEEIKREGKTNWDAGLLQNPLLGPAEDLPVFRRALAYFQNELKDEKEKLEESTTLQREGQKRFTMEIDGKSQTVEVIEAGNWLAQLLVLDNAQNPLVLAVHIAPEASPAELLFSPLGMLKGLLEYQVTEFKNPPIGQDSL